MIIDTSALLAIVFKEPEKFVFFHAISEAEPALMAAPSFVEAMITVERRGGRVALLEQLVRETGIVVRAFTAEHAVPGWQAFRQFGKGRHRLNFGDCMTYGFAKVEKLPLLFKGNDFARTDIQPALNS
ncbi:MAG: type II toxin-antitoxin system VapC family toxin [Acetobacteraceae bacterium]|nr:type II toxin-antitoxin system VapC family toxin [Acetobacteraceae bacterium]